MSDNSPFGFGRFVPGFDFLQNLAKNSAASVPAMPGWVAPTVSEEELEKRIEELKAVQFWLDQNSRALTATVQALEVQKMTLATLKGMNVAMGDLASAFAPKAPAPGPVDAAPSTAPTAPAAPSMASFFGSSRAAAADADRPEAPAQAPSQAGADALAAEDANGHGHGTGGEGAAGEGAAAASGGAAAAPGVVDPMQWWTALSTQFQQIAAHALQDVAQHQGAFDATRNMASEAMKTATDVASHLAAQGMQGMQVPARKASPAKSARTRSAAGKAEPKGGASAPRGTATSKRAAAKPGTNAAASGGKRPAAKAPAKTPGKASPTAKAPAAPRTTRPRPAR